MESDQMESRVRLKKFLFSGITSCLSVRRKDSQGCTADVKDTPPSPKEKPDDLIGPDIDPVGDHDDLMTERNRLSIESFDSGVSFKSDRSKDGLIDFKDRVSPSRLDLSSFEKKHDVADDGFFESPDDLMTERNRLSIESFDSGVSFKSDRSKDGLIDFKDRVSPSRLDLSYFEKKHDVADDGFFESPDDLMAERNRLSIESFDSGVSFKSDRSKDGLIDFKDRVSPSRLDLSYFEKKHDVADDGFFESPDDLMAVRRTLSEPAKSGFHIALRQQSPLMMAHRSLEAFGSGLTLMNDSFICPRQRSLPREEMNQELSSEVGWKHG